MKTESDYFYKDQWEYFKFWRFMCFVSITFCIPFVLFIAYISIHIVRDYWVIKYIVWGFLSLWGSLIAFSAYKFLIFYCPRCRKSFSNIFSKFLTRYKPERSEKCNNCQLPIYYGSVYFFEYWGSERGNELIKKLE